MKATDLLNEIALIENGWLRIEGPAGSAYLPDTAKDEAEWENRCHELHKNLHAFRTNRPDLSTVATKTPHQIVRV